jgi:valyl-tRNA synthetase
VVKPRLLDSADPSAPAARGTLVRVITDSLKLLHPFTPFITEALMEALQETIGAAKTVLMSSPWPGGEGLGRDEGAEGDMQVLMDAIYLVRQIRNLTTMGERAPLAATYNVPRARARAVLEAHASTVKALGALETCTVGSGLARPFGSASAVAGGLEVFLPLPESVDRAKLKESLEKRGQKVRQGIAQIEAKLSNQAFLERADPEVVVEERARRADLELELSLVERNLAGF